MAWKIDRDYLDGTTDRSKVGTMSLGPDLEGETFRFRLRDDDGEVYYGGVADKAAAEADEDEQGGLYEAYRWGTYDSGTTDLQMHPADGLKYGLTSRKYLKIVGIAPDDPKAWVSIYG
jgi:hypothetical protein